jgi:hypothetical protein
MLSVRRNELIYQMAALEPKISKTTLTLHHDKHHAKYVTVANQVGVIAISDEIRAGTCMDALDAFISIILQSFTICPSPFICYVVAGIGVPSFATSLPVRRSAHDHGRAGASSRGTTSSNGTR